MRNPLPRRGHNELFRKKLLSPGAAPQQVDRVSAQSRQPLPHLDRLPNSGNLGNETAGPNRATGRVRHQAVEIVVVATGVARSDRSVPVSVYHRTRATRARQSSDRVCCILARERRADQQSERIRADSREGTELMQLPGTG